MKEFGNRDMDEVAKELEEEVFVSSWFSIEIRSVTRESALLPPRTNGRENHNAPTTKLESGIISLSRSCSNPSDCLYDGFLCEIWTSTPPLYRSMGAILQLASFSSCFGPPLGTVLL